MVPRSFRSMFSAFPRFGPLAVGLIIVTWGCSSTTTYRLTNQEFPANPEPSSVLLLAGEPTMAYQRIAHINSSLDEFKDNSAKERQLADLRQRAAALGADAVINIQHLEQHHQGMVADETVPFVAWRPGDLTQYFMRGTAVRYVIEDEISAEIDQLPGSDAPASASDIPERSTSSRATGDSRPEPQEGLRTGY